VTKELAAARQYKSAKKSLPTVAAKIETTGSRLQQHASMSVRSRVVLARQDAAGHSRPGPGHNVWCSYLASSNERYLSPGCLNSSCSLV
jgi:hypothetical protein